MTLSTSSASSLSPDLPRENGVHFNRLSSPRDLEKELSSSLYERSGTWWQDALLGSIHAISFSAIFIVLLIFIFVTQESLPVIFQTTNNAHSGEKILLQDVAKISPSKLAAFLQVDVSQIEPLSLQVRQELVASRNEELASQTNPDSHLNTTSWALMLFPHQWFGYDAPAFIWQPVGAIEKYNMVPLFLGSLKITLVALVFAVPFSLMSAIYVSQLASSATRELIKPTIELLSGIPSVVLGFLGLVLFSQLFRPLIAWFDPSATPLNAFVAGLALALAVIPIIFTIAEDAITAVPVTHKDAARAMGATDWHATISVVVPAALPGIFAAVVLGFGRAIGETMVVLLASGNAATTDWSLFQSTRTVTATIAAELNEEAMDSDHYRILFLIGSILFLITFLGNLAADLILNHLKNRLEGSAALEDPLRLLYPEGVLARTDLGNAVV